jgi:hypothetical protein
MGWRPLNQDLDMRVVGAPAFIDDLAAQLSSVGAEPRVSTVVDPKYLGLDYGEVSDIVAIVTAMLVADPIVPTIYRWLKKKSDPPTRIIVETPLGRAVFESDQDMTEQQVKKITRRLSGLTD